jgi:hypothetical protein
MNKYLAWAVVITLSVGGMVACDSGPAPKDPSEIKIGVLLAAHGSRSSEWVGMMEAFADEVREPMLADGTVSGVRLAFITESKPSIASQMRAFDQEGYDEVIVVPLVIAVESQRTNDYLHYLTGVRSDMGQIKQLEKEGLEIYYPQARVSLTQVLNQSSVLKKNVLRRVRALQAGDSGEDMGVLLVGYGDQAYGQQMQEMMEGLGRYLKIKTDIDTVAYAFCGELVDYSGEPIVEAIHDLLDMDDEVLVVPVLLGVDKMLQTNTIEAAVNAVPTASRIRYEPTSVLPDPKVNVWAVEQVQAAVARAHVAGGKIVGKVIPASEL